MPYCGVLQINFQDLNTTCCQINKPFIKLSALTTLYLDTRLR